MKRKAIFLLYRSLEALLLPVILLYLLVRCVRNRRYAGTLLQRLGNLPALWQKTAPEAIWFHAVSVGEVICALPLMEEIRNRSPRTPLFLSTGTLAGRETAEKRAVHLLEGAFYAPLDFTWCVRRVLRRIRPSVLVILETEIWPNMIREARRLGCGIAIVNGRISDRALPRYRRFRVFFGPVLNLCDTVAVQSEDMRERFAAAGADFARIQITGNLKYDFRPTALPPDSPVHRFFGRSPLWVAASTATEEEDIVLDAHKNLPGWRLVIAPRKPERFAAVRAKLTASGLRFTCRSELTDPDADILLLDSIGELSGVFAFADVVFMGGTIANYGGHNILEPALFGKPVIAGPHLENFRDIERHFEARGALLRVKGDLAAAVLAAASDAGLGERARSAAREQQGASARTADAVMNLYRQRYPCSRAAQPAWMFLHAFSQIWRVGSAWDRARKRRKARRLPVPVVSVGNITTGGTGKTPVTIELLREFDETGLLTRGHGRSTNHIVLYLGNDLPIDLTGDEAQLYMRSVQVPMGIGGNRFETGSRLLAATELKILFLDDGFQHLQLERDFDLVVVDALNPFGGGQLLPLGLLREPLQGLSRAHCFLITRCDQAANVNAIETVLRRYNATAPIFRATTSPRYWADKAGEWVPPEEMRGKPAVAFCGLGNPDSFWSSLHSLGIETLGRHHFGDHHRYQPLEVRRLAQHAQDAGAQVLLTTAKDAVNLCLNYEELIAPLKLYWLEIGIEIDQRARMMKLLAESISTDHPGGTSVVEP